MNSRRQWWWSMMSSMMLFVVNYGVLLLALLHTAAVEGKSFRPVCNFEPRIRTIRQDRETGRWYEIDDNDNNKKNTNLRRMQSDPFYEKAGDGTTTWLSYYFSGLLGGGAINDDVDDNDNDPDQDRNGRVNNDWSDDRWIAVEGYPVLLPSSRGDRSLAETHDGGRRVQTSREKEKEKYGMFRDTNRTDGDIVGNDDEDDKVMLAKLCRCWDSFEPIFCPTFLSHCGHPRGDMYPDDRLECLDENKEKDILGNLIIVSMFWSSVLLLCMVYTTWGRHCISYMVSFLFPCCWVQLMARRMIRTEPERAHLYMRRNLHHRRRVLGIENVGRDFALEAQAVLALRTNNNNNRNNNNNNNNNTNPGDNNSGTDGDGTATANMPQKKPTALELRTCIYRVEEHQHFSHQKHKKRDNKNNNDEDGERDNKSHVRSIHSDDDDDGEDDDVSDADDLDGGCIICFQPIEEGDRIGLLDCHHTFHVECLKTWLLRRNVCPLCQSLNIARPRYDDFSSNNSNNKMNACTAGTVTAGETESEDEAMTSNNSTQQEQTNENNNNNQEDEQTNNNNNNNNNQEGEQANSSSNTQPEQTP